MPYDVFLSHNSTDKPLVRAVSAWLKNNGVKPWLDEANLEPGDRLTRKLGDAMEESRAAIIFIGPSGEGPWQSEEIDSLLNKAIELSRRKDEFRVIPVLLPDANTSGSRWFLKTRLWVDLSKGVTDNDAELFRLRQAILGKAEDGVIPGDSDFNPYMGLAAFQVKDKDLFFGRNKKCNELASRLKEWRFACVVGASGTGKSSLARAGLATEAAERAFPGIAALKRVTLVPGANLLRAFLEQQAATLPAVERAKQVADALERVDPKDGKSTADEWANRLNDEFRAHFADDTKPVLFLVDQLEEVFTQRGLLTVTEEECEDCVRKHLDCLAALVNQRDNRRWHFVLTLRSDFYQRCRLSSAFWKLISTDYRFPLDELDEEGWREAIKGPAARAGAYLETGLVETVLKDVYRQRGSMPLLQLALQQLWRLRQDACLTHAAYKTLGGVANVLQNRAEAALQHLKEESPEYFEIARNLFLRLTALGEGVTDSRRRIDRTELDWEATAPEDIDYVLAQLCGADNRLLVADADSVEVTHEVLIREADTIRGWVEGARKEIPTLRRLTHAARRWEDNQRDAAFLSAADPPRELKRWVKQTTLRLTSWELAFWKASRVRLAKEARDKRAQREALLRSERDKRKTAEASRRRAFWFTALAATLAVVAVIAGYGFLNAAKAAESAQVAAERALVDSFYRTIGTSPEKDPSGDEREALWDLATLGPENENVRKQLLARWSKSAETVVRATSHDAMGTNALTGLSATVSRHFGIEVSTLVAKALENTPESEEARLSSLASALTALAQRLSPEDTAPVAKGIAKALENTTVGEYHRPSSLALALESLAHRLSPQDAALIAQGIAKALENTRDYRHHRLRFLATALASLALRLREEDASTLTAPIAQGIAKALENTHEDADPIGSIGQAPENTDEDPDPIGSIGEALREASLAGFEDLASALASLAPRLSPEDAAPIAKGIAKALENTPGGEYHRPYALASALASLAPRLSPEDAEPIAQGLAKALENTHEGDWPRLSSLTPALKSLAQRLSPKDAAHIAQGLAKALENAPGMAKALENIPDGDEDRQPCLAGALKSLAQRLSPEDAAPIAQGIAKALENTPEGDYRRLSSLASALASLASQLSEEDASSLTASPAGVIAKALDKPPQGTPEGYDRRLSSLASALASLAQHLRHEDAAPIAKRIAKAFENSPEGDEDRLRSLLPGLAFLALRLRHEDAVPIAKRIAKAFENSSEGDEDRRISLASALASLTPALPEAPRTRFAAFSFVLPKRDLTMIKRIAESLDAKSLVEILKWPTCVGEAQKLVLETLETKLQQPGQPKPEFHGNVWVFVEQAPKLGFSRKDLERPPERPPRLEDAIAELKELQAKAARR